MKPTDPPQSLLGRTLRRRWLPILSQWIILTAALLCAAYAGRPPLYEATSILRVDPTPRDLYDGGAEEDFAAFLQTQVDLIKSANILTAAGTNPQAARLPRVQESADVVLTIRKLIRVQVRPGTNLIDVSMTSPDAHEAATLVNAVVEAFNDSNVEWTSGMARNQIKALETYLNELKNQSAEIERQWKDIVIRADGGPLAEIKGPETAIDAALRRRIEGRLVENDVRRMEAEAELESLRRSGPGSSTVKAAELEGRIQTAAILDRLLRARLASIPDPHPGKKMATDDVEITLLLQHHKSLRELQEQVTKRLEQLKFDSRGERRIRTVQTAMTPGAPVTRGARPWLVLIPFATFAATLAFFAGIEARSARAVPPPPAPEADAPPAD